MNIARSFAQFLEDQNIGTFDEDIFINAAPLDGPDSCFWILTSGGSPSSTNITGEKQKVYLLSLYYRSNAEDAYDRMHDIEELINSDACTQLAGFDTIDVETTLFPADQDLDNEDSTVCLLQIAVTTHL